MDPVNVLVNNLREESRGNLRLEQEKEIEKGEKKAVEKIHKYLKIRKLKEEITPSKSQTKEWRNSQIYKGGNGKRNECELYQRKKIETITGKSCPKTTERINTELNDIIVETQPMKRDDAFDWTEDFDGKQTTGQYRIFYNLKMVVGSGGAQTRTLREVAHFIKAQLEYNVSHMDNLSYFVNILDGDQSFKLYEKYISISYIYKILYIFIFFFI